MLGVDLVHDAAEQALLCEIETIRAWQQKLCQQLDGINTHLARGRAARHELERDLQRKEQAFQIDTGAAQLNNNSKDIAFHSGIEKVHVSGCPLWGQNVKICLCIYLD